MDFVKGQDIDLKRYLHVLLKRKWIIISIFSLSILVAFITTTRVTPFYRSTVRIVIDDTSQDNFLSIREFQDFRPGTSTYMTTQFMILKSRGLAEDVIRSLKLQDDGRFFPKPRNDLPSKITRWYGELIRSGKKTASSLFNTGSAKKTEKKSAPSKENDEKNENESEIPESLINAFIRRVRPNVVAGTKLIDVSFDSPHPRLSASVANELVKVYIEQNMDDRFKATQRALQWLNDRLEMQRKRVEEAEIALLTYKDREGILTEFSEGSTDFAAKELAELMAQVRAIESRRVDAETRYQQSLSMMDDPDMQMTINEAMSNELVQEIRKMEVVLYNRLSELKKKYGPNHPQMISVTSELEELAKRRTHEIKRIVNSLRNEYKLSLAKEEQLRKQLDELRLRLSEINKKAIQYRLLQRQAESSRQMFDMLVKRLKETSLVEDIKTSNIRIIDKARSNSNPINIRRGNSVKKAIGVGLVLGIALALMLEYLDNTVKLPDEIKNYLKIPFLGPIPAFDIEDDMNGISGELITEHGPKSTTSESFRGIRTSILFSSADIDPQVLISTSAAPSEGKTLFGANLAVAMAQAGSRVLLVDCDMRRPRVHTLFKVPRDMGIANLLVGTVTLEEAVIETPIKNLFLIPSGPVPPNPSEIIGSNKMISLIEVLRKDYDRIIFDTPPVSAVTDAAVLAPRVDGVILVIRSGVTPRQLVENALTKLRAVNAHIYGAVLNGVETSRESYYYYQNYYYYGTEDVQKKRKKKKRKKASFGI